MYVRRGTRRMLLPVRLNLGSEEARPGIVFQVPMFFEIT